MSGSHTRSSTLGGTAGRPFLNWRAFLQRVDALRLISLNAVFGPRAQCLRGPGLLPHRC